MGGFSFSVCGPRAPGELPRGGREGQHGRGWEGYVPPARFTLPSQVLLEEPVVGMLLPRQLGTSPGREGGLCSPRGRWQAKLFLPRRGPRHPAVPVGEGSDAELRGGAVAQACVVAAGGGREEAMFPFPATAAARLMLSREELKAASLQ